jgi:hypothetical protein
MFLEISRQSYAKSALILRVRLRLHRQRHPTIHKALLGKFDVGTWLNELVLERDSTDFRINSGGDLDWLARVWLARLMLAAQEPRGGNGGAGEGSGFNQSARKHPAKPCSPKAEPSHDIAWHRMHSFATFGSVVG